MNCSHPLRILIIAHAFPPQVGGVETHLWDISMHLTERGHKVLCLVGGEEGGQAHNGVSVRRHPALTVKYLLESRKALREKDRSENLLQALSVVVRSATQEFKPDLIHAHNLIHFAPELAEALQSCCRDAPIVTSIHDRVGEHLFTSVLKLPWSHTLFASEFLRSNLPACSPSSVLWLGIELERFTPFGRPDERFSDMHRPIIFHPARLLRWKGVEVGFQAFVILHKFLGTGTLVLCGSKNAATDHEEIRTLRKEIDELAAIKGLSQNVRFLEFGHEDMPPAYRASDLVWYPTIDEEPLGLVPLEAMACGIPLIVSDSGGMRETVIADQTGLVVPKNDAIALAEAAQRILRDRSLRGALVSRGLDRAKMFDNKHYVDHLMGHYVDAVSNHAGRRLHEQ